MQAGSQARKMAQPVPQAWVLARVVLRLAADPLPAVRHLDLAVVAVDREAAEAPVAGAGSAGAAAPRSVFGG